MQDTGTYLNGLLPKSFSQKITKNTKTDLLKSELTKENGG
jgi:hypothetical protein